MGDWMGQWDAYRIQSALEGIVELERYTYSEGDVVTGRGRGQLVS